MRVQTKAGLLWRALEVVMCVALLGPGGVFNVEQSIDYILTI
jgi:hypothetical protein